MVEKTNKMSEVRIMTYEELIEKAKQIFGEADVSRIQEHLAYQFNIEGETEGAFYAEVSQGHLSIEPYEYFDRDVLFITSADTLLRIAQGEMDPIKAFTLGKLKVEGDFDKALLLQKFCTKKEEKMKTKEGRRAKRADRNK